MSKTQFMEAKTALNRLLTSDEGARNLEHLPKEYIEKLQRIAVMNSLAAMSVKMFDGKCNLEVDYSDLKSIPLIKITKKA